VNPMIPPPEPARHGINETLSLIDGIRAIAHDRSLDDDDAMRRIRDLLADHNQAGPS
jgi:hypothetical protein